MVSARRRLTSLAMAFAVIAVVACESDSPLGPVRPVANVFAVLDPSRAEQVILIEETRASAAPATPPPFDVLDPVVSLGYAPISGARVVLSTDRGDSTIAIEDVVRRSDGRGRGVYVIAGLRLEPGDHVRLRAATSHGPITGATVIPGVSRDAWITGKREINLDHRSAPIEQRTAPADAGYLLSLSLFGQQQFSYGEYGYGQLGMLLPVPSIAVAPDKDNNLSYVAGELVEPGTVGRVTILAIDRYYRSYLDRSDQALLTDRGGSLSGADGLFAAVTPVIDASIEFTADMDDPLEGRYVAAPAFSGAPTDLTLYIAYKSSDGYIIFSGNWRADPDSSVHELRGSGLWDNIELDFGPTRNSLNVDFHGAQASDSLSGWLLRYTGSAPDSVPVTFVKQ